MKRSLPVLFGLLLVFAFVTSVVIAQRAAPVRLAPLSDGTLTLIYIPPPTPTTQPSGNTFNPGDPDGDGIPNGIDQCPDQGGPSSNNGCPLGTTGTVAQPSAPTTVLPVMPFTGDCVLATRSDQGVNIRIQPSTSAEIVGVLDSQSLYPVNGQHNDADGAWDRIEDGWVARHVVRLGGDCDTLPEITLQEGPTYSLANPPISCDVDELINAIKNAPDGSTINLAPGCIYTLTQAYGDSLYGLPLINIRLNINGNGATIRRSSAGGTPAFAIFDIWEHGHLTLNDLTLRNGKSASTNTGPTVGGCGPCGGGAIENEGGSLVLNNATLSNNTEGGAIVSMYVGATVTVTNSTFSRNSSHIGGGAISSGSGTLTVTNSTFSDNSSLPPYGYNDGDGEGGAIYSSGTLTVTNSTFSGNSATGDPGRDGHGYGGAIYGYGTLTINSSTFSGNTADYGGGIVNNVTAAVSNSTFYGNLAITGGGAIYNPGSLALTNSTVASNMAVGTGGGIDNTSSIKVSLGSSIVSGNSGVGPDLFGDFKSLGYNVIGSSIGATITGNSTGNRVNAAASPLNLGDLSSNGGPTQTLSIDSGSVAIGSGNCASMAGTTPVTTDQRGEPRKPTCDAGAYES